VRNGTSPDVVATVVSVVARTRVMDRPGNTRRLVRNDVVRIRRPCAGCRSETDGHNRRAGDGDDAEGHEPTADSTS
jgi:hypothetical protein